MPDRYIATRVLTAHHPERGDFAVTIHIGEPYLSSDVDWACPVALEGLYSNLAPQHGIDSWQALMLSLNLARTLVEGFLSDGGTLIDSVTGTPLASDAFFRTGI